MVDIYVTQKKYNIIYADPPWEYNKRKNKNTRFGGGAGGHYDIMNLQEIRNLPVQKISENDCALFLWVTFPKLKEQLDVFESWGFKYVTLGFSWIKTYKKSGTPCFGIGYYTKSNCEVCLLGIKGKLFRPTNTLTRYLKNEQNKSIVLYLPKLYGEKFVINKLLNSWCSFRTTWQDCPMYEDRALRYTSDGNNITIDLTQEYGKNAVAGYGFMLRRQSEGEHIAVSTGDSLYFPYIIEIK